MCDVLAWEIQQRVGAEGPVIVEALSGEQIRITCPSRPDRVIWIDGRDWRRALMTGVETDEDGAERYLPNLCCLPLTFTRAIDVERDGTFRDVLHAIRHAFPAPPAKHG